VALTVASVRHVIRHPQAYSEEEQTLPWFFLAAVLVFCGLYLMTDATYNARYALPVAVFALPVIAVYLNRLPWRPGWKEACCLLLAAAVAFNAALAYHELLQKDGTGELRTITRLLQSDGYTEGYASYWNANVVTELSNGEVDVRCWGSNNTNELTDIDQVKLWLQVKTHQTTVPEGPVFVLFNNRERNAFTIVSRMSEQAILYRSDEYVLYGYASYSALKSDLAEGGGA